MANENDIVFSMNAGQLICKLHLAGQEQLLKSKCISINTGYINPDIKATPANPGNVDFNLDNKGLYELEHQNIILNQMLQKTKIQLKL